MENTAGVTDTLSVWVLGRRGAWREHRVCNPDPRTLLVDWLREDLGLTGVKIGCNEGGCGACTVVVGSGQPVRWRAVNSCLRLLCSCDGMCVVVTEALGNTNAGLHPLQKALADGNGSQCGYCSPGWVAAVYGLLQRDGGATQAELEKYLDGNICRCTGYRSILDAFRSFCTDAPEAAPVPEPYEEAPPRAPLQEAKLPAPALSAPTESFDLLDLGATDAVPMEQASACGGGGGV